MAAESVQERLTIPLIAQPDARRQYPRVSLYTAVEIETLDGVVPALSENVSVGGMLVRCQSALTPGTPITVSFILSGSGRLKIPARAVHCRAGVRAGIQFLELTQEQRSALTKYTQPIILKQRRSARIPVRLFVQLSWVNEGLRSETAAETVLLSKHGCLVLSKSTADVGANILLQWPETGTTAEARIVSRQDCPDELPRLAMEFVGVDDFWGSYFSGQA